METLAPIRPFAALRSGVVGARRGLWQSAATILAAAIVAGAALLVADLLADRAAWLAALAWLSTALLIATLALGCVRLSLRLHDGHGAGLPVLFACAGEAPAALAAGAVACVALALVVLPAVSLTVTFALLAAVVPLWTPLAVAGGAAALILAVWAGSRYLFLAHVVADRGLGPGAALRAATALTRGRRNGAAVLLALLVLLNALGACAAGAGLLLTLPVSLAALAYAYRTVVPAARSTRPTLETATGENTAQILGGQFLQ